MYARRGKVVESNTNELRKYVFFRMNKHIPKNWKKTTYFNFFISTKFTFKKTPAT